MIIKTFRAETSAAALKRVREEMGGDAVVLKTTQVTGSGSRSLFEVTACLENPTVAQTNMIFPDATPVSDAMVPLSPEVAIEEEVPVEDYRPEPVKETQNEITVNWESRFKDLDAKLSQILVKTVDKENPRFAPFEFVDESFRRHDVDSDFALEFLAELLEEYNHTMDAHRYAEEKLVEIVSTCMVPEFELSQGDRVAFIGSAGGGKSSVMGKFATQLVVQDKKKVSLISLDDVKMGALDETAAYAEILGTSYSDTRTAFEESTVDETAVTLIDTVALPNVRTDLTPLKERLDAMQTTHRIAVISGTERAVDIKRTVSQLKELGATHLIITKEDLTDCLGSLISASYQTGLKIIYTTDSQGGIGKLQSPDPAKIVRSLIIREEVDA